MIFIFDIYGGNNIIDLITKFFRELLVMYDKTRDLRVNYKNLEQAYKLISKKNQFLIDEYTKKKYVM